MQIQQISEQKNSNLDSILRSLSIPVLFLDLDCKVQALNNAAENLYKTQETLENTKCYNLQYCIDEPCQHTQMKSCPIKYIKKNLLPVIIRHEHYDKTNKKLHFEIIMNPFFNDEGAFIGVVETWHEITQYVNKQQELLEVNETQYHSSMHDPLTKLPNRRLLLDRIQQAIHQKSRTKKTFGLFFLDLDFFKEVNDTLGHQAGDLLLIEVAQRMQQVLRKGDTVARLGGDEFVLILEDWTASCHYEKIAKKIIAQFMKPFHINMQNVSIGCSIGISLFPQDGDTHELLLSHADSAMYKAKKLGRKQYAFYSNTETSNSTN